ncbi:hypothetical protein ACNKHK_08430 [Shigella flexneri]
MKFVWHCDKSNDSYCATLKTPPRCTWKSSIIRGAAARFTDAGPGLFELVAAMTGLLKGQRGEWSEMASESHGWIHWHLLTKTVWRKLLLPGRSTHQCKQQGLHFIQPGRFVLPGIWRARLRCNSSVAGRDAWERNLAQADKHTNAGMLREVQLLL